MEGFIIFVVIMFIFNMITKQAKKKEQQQKEARRAEQQARASAAAPQQPSVYARPDDPRFPSMPHTQTGAAPSAQSMARATQHEQAQRERMQHEQAQREQMHREQAQHARQQRPPTQRAQQVNRTVMTSQLQEISETKHHTLDASYISGHAHTESSMGGSAAECPPTPEYGGLQQRGSAAPLPGIPSGFELGRLIDERNELARGVLLAEVLGKPKALRRR